MVYPNKMEGIDEILNRVQVLEARLESVAKAQSNKTAFTELARASSDADDRLNSKINTCYLLIILFFLAIVGAAIFAIWELNKLMRAGRLSLIIKTATSAVGHASVPPSVSSEYEEDEYEEEDEVANAPSELPGTEMVVETESVVNEASSLVNALRRAQNVE